jgi:predicted transglutaminase-like cysteine proteinase
MDRYSFFSAFAAIAALLPINVAQAGERASLEPKALAPIAQSGPTLAPFQHVRFCLRYPSDCQASSGESSRIESDASTLELLTRINRDVNNAIAPRTKSYGANIEDRWTVSPISGDCNDYAVTKRRKLIESGVPAGALRLSVTKTANGEGHLVLVVATNKADLVLDNLVDAIKPWQYTNYQWIKIQSATNPRVWNEIRPPAGAITSQSIPKSRIGARSPA